MANNQLKNFMLIASFLIAGLFVFKGWKASAILRDKTVAQLAEAETIYQWKQSYKALSGTRAKWENNYPRLDAMQQDSGALTAHVNLTQYGLQTDSDNVVVSSVDALTGGGQPLGLTKICLSTGSSNGNSLLVAADNYENLMKGVDRLSKRPDISLGNIVLQGGKSFPIARLGDFCVLLKNS